MLLIQNLTSDTSLDKITKMFQKHGTINKVEIVTQVAIVSFANNEDAQKAIKALNGRNVDGKNIKLNLIID